MLTIKKASTTMRNEPTFSETQLHSLLQHNQLTGTPLDGGTFVSLDREDLPKTVSKWVEFVFLVPELSVTEATEILGLARTILLNETTGELTLSHLYRCTREHGLRAGMMNLHPDVVALIPWVGGPFENAPMGDGPSPFRTAKLWSSLPDLIPGILMAIGIAAGDYLSGAVDTLKEAALKTIVAISAAMEWLVENLVKAALLAFFYTMFAISLLFIRLSISIIFLITVIFSKPLGYEITYSASQIFIQNEKNSIQIGYSTQLEYNDFLDLKIPSVFTFFKMGVMSLTISFNFYAINLDALIFESMSLNSMELDSKAWNEDSGATLKSSNDLANIVQILNHMNLFVGVFGSLLGVAGGIMVLGHTIKEELMSLGLIASSLTAYFVGYLMSLMVGDFTNPLLVFVGLMLGGFFSAVACFSAQGISILSWPALLFKLTSGVLPSIYSLISLVLSSIGFALPWTLADLIIEIMQAPLSFLVLIAGIAIISSASDTARRDRILLSAGFIALFAPLAIMFMIIDSYSHL